MKLNNDQIAFSSSWWHCRQNFLLSFYDACPHQNRFVAYNLKGPACFLRHLIPSSGVNRPGNRVNFSSDVSLSTLSWQTCLTTPALSLSLFFKFFFYPSQGVQLSSLTKSSDKFVYIMTFNCLSWFRRNINSLKIPANHREDMSLSFLCLLALMLNLSVQWLPLHWKESCRVL